MSVVGKNWLVCEEGFFFWIMNSVVRVKNLSMFYVKLVMEF